MLLWTIIIILTFLGLSLTIEGESDTKPFGCFCIIIALLLSFISGWGRGGWRWHLNDGNLYRVEYVMSIPSNVGGNTSHELLLRRESDGELTFVIIENQKIDGVFTVGKLYTANGYLGLKDLKPVPGQ